MRLKSNLEKAEAALEAQAGSFQAWLGESIAKLDRAREDLRRATFAPDTLGVLYMHAHDLKGMAATLGFPIVGKLAAEICVLFDDPTHLPAEQIGLVDDHIDAIKAVFSGDIRTEHDPRARQLLDDLERDIRER